MRRIVAVVLFAALVISSAACSVAGSTGSERGAGSASGAGDEAVGTSTTSPPPNDPIPLKELVTTRAELQDGETLTAPEAARDLETGSLGYCNIHFPSESLRTARHQVTLEDADDKWAGVTEAIRYEPGGSIEALDDMRAAFLACPDDEYIKTKPSSGTRDPDAPGALFDNFPLAEEDLADVAEDHVAARLTFTDPDGSVMDTFVVVQRRGNVVIISIAPEEDRLLDLANAAGRRLSAAPASSLGD